MATPLQRQSVNAVGIYGVMREAEVDSRLIPDGAVTEARNFHFDRKGAATVRPGITTLTASAVSAVLADGNKCIGLHNAQSSFILACFSNANVRRYTTANGWELSTLFFTGGDQGSAQLRFVDFLGRSVAITGTPNSMAAYNGKDNNWEASNRPLNLHTAPNGCKFGEVYKSRLYLASNSANPSRLFFSSVVTSNGEINWTPSTDFVDINPSDGEEITGLKRYSLELVVFKPNYIYRFRTSGLDPDPLIKVGTRSQESVVEGKKGLYFHHDSGFYRYSGGYPVEISLPIIDFIQAVPFSQYDDIVGWRDDDHIYWSLGNLSISEYNQTVSWKNVVARYTESSDAWTVYSYPFDIRRGITYVSSAQKSTVVASDAQVQSGTGYGIVATMNSGTTDCGEPIKYHLVTKWYEWEGIETLKILQTFVAVTEKSLNAVLMYQVNNEMAWNEAGNLDSFLTLFEKQNIKFNRIRFKVAGMTRNESAVFNGLEILEGVNEGLITTSL